jgi:hypothetical protein
MKTSNLLVSVLMIVSVLFSACTPAVTVTQAPTTAPTQVPPTEAPTAVSTFLGDPIPEKFLNVDYFLEAENPPNVLHFYAPDDPICIPLKIEGNCFTILRPDSPSDPGARGPVALIDGVIAATFQLCPFCDSSDIGTIEYFEPKEDGGVLVGVKCETKTGATCNADVGTTWKPAPQQTTFHSPENASFRIPLSFTYGPEWAVRSGAVGALDIIYQNQWGPTIFLVTGAQVADPKDTTKLIPWPDDFFAYVASFSTVKVMQGPDPVTIGGVQGDQIIFHTSSGPCFGLWLKGDYTWIGSGPNCGDGKSQMILLDVNGESVLLWFPESSEKFDEHYPLVQEIFNSITFGK